MICNGHVSHRENNTHKIYIIDRSINQLINHFYRCMKKTDHILAIIPHEEETNTVSEAPVSSSQAELSYSQHCSYLLVDQGITHWQILHKVHSLITAAEAENAHNWKHTDQQNTAARTSTDTRNEKVWSHCICKHKWWHIVAQGVWLEGYRHSSSLHMPSQGKYESDSNKCSDFWRWPYWRCNNV